MAQSLKTFYPEYEDLGEGKELIADVGYIARLRNPFKVSRTLTICNGIHSRGVFGAVRCLTDASVREENEKYLADRFPDGEFAMLLRVPVVTNETLSPDLQNPERAAVRVGTDSRMVVSERHQPRSIGL